MGLYYNSLKYIDSIYSLLYITGTFQTNCSGIKHKINNNITKRIGIKVTAQLNVICRIALKT